jgi:hypothetical protein
MSMYAKAVAMSVALQARMSWIGRLLWRSSTSERPSGRIEIKLNNSLALEVIRGLERESLIDPSRLDLLSFPADSREVLSVSQRANTASHPSQSTR